MLKQLEGSRAVAEAVAMCRPQVICAYPITPQTHIVEALSAMVKAETLDAEFLNVESEFAAMSVAIGASAAGARAYTATASQGLLYMSEAVWNAAGLGRDGYMLVNSARGFGELGLGEFVRDFRRDRLLVVPASSLALTHLGRPLPGAALLGGFAALTWAVSLDSVLAAINDKFSGPVADGNAEAARAAFGFVRDEREALIREAPTREALSDA